ncbi:MAG TPA: cytochrome P460 family protein [Pyrinomonadaceae bacterium]|nr:cytochrome P460 family protein [Pyrinomonadaceae bacterium]
MNRNFLKLALVTLVLLLGFAGFLFTRTTEMQTAKPAVTPEKKIEGIAEIAGYQNWTKVNEKPDLMVSKVAIMCAMPSKEMIAKDATNPHNNKYIDVFVNDLGKTQMLTKKNPKFPVGTVIVKEKLTKPDSKTPELLTIMIKREKGFNAEVGDWEFLTANGSATEITAKGKLETCQACHLDYKSTDYVTRTYLPYALRQKLK